MGLGTEIGLRNLVEDLSPQLGGHLDVNGFSIVSSANGNIVIEPNGSGIVSVTSTIRISNPTPILVLKDNTYVGDSSLGFTEWRDANNTRLGFFGNSSSGDSDLLWKNESSGGHIGIQTTGGGEVQIFANLALDASDLLLGDDDEIQSGDTAGGDMAQTWDGSDYTFDWLSGNVEFNVPGAPSARTSRVVITGGSGASGGEPLLQIVQTNSTGNSAAFQIVINGVQKFLVDNEGDVNCGASLNAGSGGIGGGYDPIRFHTSANNGMVFGSYSAVPARSAVKFGYNSITGGYAPSTNFSHDEMTIQRVGDCTDTYTESGSVLRLHRDLENVSGDEAGNFQEWGGSGGSVFGYLDREGNLRWIERSSDPFEPAEGEAVVWMSDGTGKGDDGDVLIASKAGGVTKWGTLFDHSTGNAW